MTKLLFFVGSLRAASSSRAVATTLAERISDKAETAFADIAGLPHYNADIENDPNVAALIDAIAGADGLVFVTPEYNYSVPGVLKNAIDWASRPAYQSVFKDKPCLVMTTSGGAMGGVRTQSHLKYILNGMLARLFPTMEVIVPMANKKVEDGRLTDQDTIDFAGKALDGFIAWIEQA